MSRKINTLLANSIEHIGKENPAYDKNAKELLGDVQVLARIVKRTLAEFENMSIEEIEACISNIEIAKINVEPGLTNAHITKLTQENSFNGEGTIYFDVRFDMHIQSEDIKILMNIEAQKNENPGYPLEKRIVFYLSRMISAQKDHEFFNSDYGKIKKVVSVWICISDVDSIDELSLSPKHIFGEDNFFDEYENIMSAYVIRIRDNKEVQESKDSLISMLEDLFRKEEIDLKKAKLQRKHHLRMTTEFEGRISQMCNLSERIEENARIEGRKKDIEKMLRAGKTPEQIAEFCGYDLSFVLSVQVESTIHD